MFFYLNTNAQILKNDVLIFVDKFDVVQRRDQFSIEISFKKYEQKNIILNLFETDKIENLNETIEIDENLARSAIKLTPEIPFTLTQTQYGLILLGNFTPETDYQITINNHLKDKMGNALKEKFIKTFHVGNFKPQFNFLNKSRFIPPNLQKSISYETINLNEVEISIHQIYPQNIHQLLSTNDSVTNNLSDIIKTETVSIKNLKDKKIKGTFSLESINPLGQGVFYLEAKAKNEKLDATILVVTELNVVIKLGGDQTLHIWTFNNSNLKPLQDVKVILNSESNFKMGECTTKGVRGYCEITWNNKSRIPFSVNVKKGLDQFSLRLSDLLVSQQESLDSKRNYFLKDQPYDGFIYSERNLYRAGEIIHFAAQVRNAKFESIKSLPLTWKIFDANNEQYKEFTTLTSEFGTALLDLPTHHLYKNGIYNVKIYSKAVMLNSYSFRIENYTPEHFLVKLSAEKEVDIKENKAKFNVKTTHRLGTQPIITEYTADCELEEAFQTIPNHPEYQTGTYVPNKKKSFTVIKINGVIAKNESESYLCDFSELLKNLPKTVYRATSNITVSEQVNSVKIMDTTHILLSSTNSNLGIKAKQNPENNSLQINGMIFDLNGNIQKENHKISIEFLQINENQISINNNTELKIIETLNPKSIIKTIQSQDGTFETTFTPPLDWRKWIIRATDENTKMVTEIALNSLLSLSENNEYAPIDMEVSKSELVPGEKFKVVLRPAFSGELLIGIESFKVIEQHWLHIEKSKPIELEFKAPETSPNFYVTALLLKVPILKNNKLITTRSWNSKSINILPKTNTLNVQISTPESIQTEENLIIQLTNKEKIQSEYTIALVDEELLSLSEFKTPNPLLHYFDSRKLDAHTFESLNAFTNNIKFKTDTNETKTITGSLNKKNKNLIHFWRPNIKSDKFGAAQISIPIPDFQGNLKIFVVASAPKLMGSSETLVQVKNKFYIETQLPEFLTVNDIFDFNFRTHINEKESQSKAVNIQFTDPLKIEKFTNGILFHAESSKQISFKSQTMNFPKPIQVKFLIKNDSNIDKNTSIKKNPIQREDTQIEKPLEQQFPDQTTEITKKKWVRNIQIPTYSNGVEQFLKFNTPADQKLNLITALPPIWNKDNLKIHLLLTDIPLIASFSHLSTLWSYPYENLEQLTSKILPLIENNDLLSLAEGDAPEISTPLVHFKVQNYLNKIMSQQTLDGGFSLWPNENTAHPWASVFAIYALSIAKRSGYTISSDIYNKALNFLQETIINNTDDWQWNENEKPEFTFALYILAKNKKNISKVLEQVSSNLNQLNKKNSEGFGFENLFLLAITAKLTGNSVLLKKIMANKNFAKKVFSENFNEKSFSSTSFWSSLRMDGLRLNILLDEWPGHSEIASLTERITTTLGLPKKSYSSQDLSWSLLALSKSLKNLKTEQQKSENIILHLNEKTFKPNFRVRGIPIWYFSGEDLLSSSFHFLNIENDQFYFHTKVSGYTMSPPPSLSPINVERTYLLPNGNEADETELKIGDPIIVELRIFNPRSIHFRSVALVDRLPSGLVIDNANAYSKNLTWMNKNIFHVEYYDFFENQLQVFGDLTDTEKYYYYQVRAINSGRFKAPSAKVELMYIPDAFDFSSESTVGVSP
jgi:hypothetical protein